MSRLMKGFKLILIAMGLILGLFLIGFVLFANSIDHNNGALVAKADGIVALTGGDSRIKEAVKILSEKKGERLLITGVHPATTRRVLKALIPKHSTMFECCIDIDHAARNTIGNAVAAKAWVSNQRFSSVIVVTSSYHMPRSLVELRRAMPDVKLVPFPVAPRNFHIEEWWAYPGTMRLLAMEYLKFIASVARLGASEIVRYVSNGSVAIADMAGINMH